MDENSKLIDVNGLSVFLEGIRQETLELVAESRTTNEIFSSTQPSSQPDGDVWTKLL